MNDEYNIILDVRNGKIAKKDFFANFNDVIEQLESEYSYTKISKKALVDNFYVELNRWVKNITKEQLKNTSFIEFVKKSYDDKILQYVKLMSKKDKTIVVDFVEECLKTTPKELAELLKKVKKILVFLNMCDFNSEEDFTYLLKNSKSFKNLVASLYEKLVSAEQLDYLVTDDFVKLFAIYDDLYDKDKLSEKEEVFEEEKDETVDSYYSDLKNVYIKEMKAKFGDLLTSEEELELARKIQLGDKKALEEFVGHNWRLAFSKAKRYFGIGTDDMDIIGAANLGLLEAAKRFDPDKNFRFSTYAVWYIKKSILDEIQDSSRNIRIPRKQYFNMLELKKCIDEYKGPNMMEELSKRLDVSEDTLKLLIFYLNDTVSLNVRVGEDDDSELMDFIPNDQPGIEEAMIDSEIVKKVLNAKYLSEREKKVISLRYGLEDGVVHTFEEIGKILSAKRQYAYDVHNKALSKIKLHFMKNPY